MTTPADVVEWRAWGESWLAVLIPTVAVFGGLLLLLQATGSGWSAAGVVLGLFGLLMVGVGTLLVVVLYRTRTRILPEGIEIRQARPEVLPWSDIESVDLDPNTGRRTISVSLRDGRTRTLPTPTQGKRPATDATLDDAVAAMRRRLR